MALKSNTMQSRQQNRLNKVQGIYGRDRLIKHNQNVIFYQIPKVLASKIKFLSTFKAENIDFKVNYWPPSQTFFESFFIHLLPQNKF